MLPQTPAFRPHLSVQLLDDHQVLIRSEAERYLLRGALYHDLCRLIDGQRELDQIVDLLAGDEVIELRPTSEDGAPAGSPGFAIEDVYYAVTLLQRRGFITEHRDVPPGSSAHEQAFWSSIGLSSADAIQSLGSRSVQVLATDPATDTAWLSELLRAMGVAVKDDGEVAVVVTDHYQHPRLAALNQELLRAGKTWLLVRPLGVQLWLGPLFEPGTTACWACLDHRLLENGYRWHDPAREAGWLKTSPPGTLHSNVRAASALAATQIAAVLASVASHPLRDTLITLDTATLQTTPHFVIRRPHCPVCGDGASSVRDATLPVELRSADKQFTADGGHRIMSPGETYDHIRRYVSPISGIVDDLVRTSPRYSSLLHVYRSSRNRSMSPHHDTSLEAKGMVAGKGMTEIQAMVSCIGEGLERYCCEFQGNEHRFTASYAEIADSAIHPDKLQQFSDWQYANRKALNANNLRFNLIPERFDEHAPLEWYDAWSLTRSAWRRLPAAFCYFDYSLCPFIKPDSNGCAGGNSVEEAIFQGFMELIERDAVAIWWYNRLRLPRVDLGGFHEPFFAAMENAMTGQGRTMRVIDLTTDLGIPVFVAVSWDARGGDIYLGMGAHLEARLAIARSITEMNQAMFRASHARAFSPAQDGSCKWNLETWLSRCTIDGEAYCRPLDGTVRTSNDYPAMASGSIVDDIRRCVAIMEQHGMEVIVSRLSRRDLRYETVRVTVPGLRHFWWRLAPGRLYDVPVNMGWLDRATGEHDLNPIPFFL